MVWSSSKVRPNALAACLRERDDRRSATIPKERGVSISESPDMRFFGLSDGHLKDAMAAYAIYLLSSGATLAYGAGHGVA